MELLSDILGQPTALETLRRAVQQQQPFHAYLFHGPEAVGKRTAALAFTRALLCRHPTAEGDACGACNSCHKMDSGSHPDFRIIGLERGGKGSAAAESERWRIGIDQIRQNSKKPRVTPPPLVTDAFYHPIESDWKVYLIDPADLLTDDAGSALLKLLEEPPSFVVIILVAAVPNAVLPTLRSRCWPIGFRIVPRKAIETALSTRGFSAQQAKLFAALSEGRIGWALTAAGKEEIERARQETVALLARLPRMPREELLRFAESLREIARDNFSGENHDSEEEGAPAKRWDSERQLRSSLPPVLDLVITWFRDLLLTTQQAERLITNEDFSSLLTEQAAQLTTEQLRACLLATIETKRLLQRFANPTLATEALAIKLHRAVS